MAKVHMFTATPGEIDTNSFLIETSNSVVAVDAQFLATPARQVRALLDRIGKPLAALIITHAHPDHFNGIDVLLEGIADVPILSTPLTLSGIHACASKIRDKWLPMYGAAEYPVVTRFPNVMIKREQRLTVDDTEIHIDSLGPGEAPDISIVNLPQSGDLLLGDVLYDRTHAWVFEQHSREWLAQLNDIQQRYPRTEIAYSGHGGAGPLSLIDGLRDYIERLRDFVVEGSSAGAVSPRERSAIIARVKQTFAGYRQDWWVPINVEAMARECGISVM
jgi:glyoxylase-like metal-dependent hydrolase (beta-lactamase superfamily II)